MTAFRSLEFDQKNHLTLVGPSFSGNVALRAKPSKVSKLFKKDVEALSLSVIAAGLQEKAVRFESIVGGDLGKRMSCLMISLGRVLAWSDDLGFDEGASLYDKAVTALDDATLILQLHRNLEIEGNLDGDLCMGNELVGALLSPELNSLGFRTPDNGELQGSATTVEKLLRYGWQCLTYRLLTNLYEILDSILAHTRLLGDPTKSTRLCSMARVGLLCILEVLNSELFYHEASTQQSKRSPSSTLPLILVCKIKALLSGQDSEA